MITVILFKIAYGYSGKDLTKNDKNEMFWEK